jgi:hypothetical protein
MISSARYGGYLLRRMPTLKGSAYLMPTPKGLAYRMPTLKGSAYEKQHGPIMQPTRVAA